MFHLPLARHAVLALAALTLAGVAGAAPTAAEAAYRADRAACLDGSSQQERSACLREAGAALAEARRGRLGHAGDATFAANAIKRCAVHTAADARLACERLAAGEGSSSGSAAGGGILRTLTTAVPAPDPVPAKPAP